MDAQTALTNLYMASRLALLTAEQHEKLRESAEFLDKLVKPEPQPEPKISEQPATIES